MGVQGQVRGAPSLPERVSPDLTEAEGGHMLTRMC